MDTSRSIAAWLLRTPAACMPTGAVGAIVRLALLIVTNDLHQWLHPSRSGGLPPLDGGVPGPPFTINYGLFRLGGHLGPGWMGARSE